MAETEKLKIALDRDELGQAIALARKQNVDFELPPEAQLVEPVSWILIGGGALLIGKFIYDLCEKFKGGVLVDLQPHPPAVTRNKHLPAGLVVVIAHDGEKVEIKTHDAPKDAAERLLSELVNGSLTTAKEVASKAIELLGHGSMNEEPEKPS